MNNGLFLLFGGCAEEQTRSGCYWYFLCTLVVTASRVAIFGNEWLLYVSKFV
jgi:hypothetical protein